MSVCLWLDFEFLKLRLMSNSCLYYVEFNTVTFPDWYDLLLHDNYGIIENIENNRLYIQTFL